MVKTNKKNKSTPIDTQAARKLTPAMVVKFLKGISFPLPKNDLVKAAKKNQAPALILEILNQFDHQEDYTDVVDVSKEIGRVRAMYL